MQPRRDFRVHGAQVAVDSAGVGPAAELRRVGAEAFGQRGAAARDVRREFLQCAGEVLRTARQDFRRREYQCRRHVFSPALGRGVEQAHRVDFVVEELTAHGAFHLRGEYVEDSAAQGELSGAFHFRATAVARERQALGQFGQVGAGVHAEFHRQRQQSFRGESTLQEGVGGGDYHARVARGHAPQRRDAPPFPLPGSYCARVKVPLPRRERHAGFAGQGGQVRRKLSGLAFVAADEDRGASRRERDSRPDAGALYGLDTRHGGRTVAAFDLPDEFGDFRHGVQLPEECKHTSFSHNVPVLEKDSAVA